MRWRNKTPNKNDEFRRQLQLLRWRDQLSSFSARELVKLYDDVSINATKEAVSVSAIGFGFCVGIVLLGLFLGTVGARETLFWCLIFFACSCVFAGWYTMVRIIRRLEDIRSGKWCELTHQDVERLRREWAQQAAEHFKMAEDRVDADKRIAQPDNESQRAIVERILADGFKNGHPKSGDFRIGDLVRLHPMEGRILAIHTDVIYISLTSPGYDGGPWCVKFAGVSEIIEAAPGRKIEEGQ